MILCVGKTRSTPYRTYSWFWFGGVLSPGDVSLECFTSDLQNITCQWDQNIYKTVDHKLFYRQAPRSSQRDPNAQRSHIPAASL